MKKNSLLTTSLLAVALTMGSVVVESAYAFGTRVFSVTRVAAWDRLNVRDEPGANHEVIGTIPSDGEGVVILGETEKIGNSTWANVAWGPIKGWVNKRYLKPMYAKNKREDEPKYRSRVAHPKSSDKQTVKLECGGIKPFWNIDITEDDIRVNIKNEHYNLPVSSRRKLSLVDKSFVIRGISRGDTAKLYLRKDNVCKDGITNIKYPYTVNAIINGDQSYSGCCSAVTE